MKIGITGKACLALNVFASHLNQVFQECIIPSHINLSIEGMDSQPIVFLEGILKVPSTEKKYSYLVTIFLSKTEGNGWEANHVDSHIKDLVFENKPGMGVKYSETKFKEGERPHI